MLISQAAMRSKMSVKVPTFVGLLFCAISPYLSGGEPQRILRCRSKPMVVVFSPKGSYIAAGCEEGTVTIWNTGDWKKTSFQAVQEDVRSISFFKNQPWIITSGNDAEVNIWDILRSKKVASIEGSHVVARLALAPDGRSFAANLYSTREIELVELKTKSVRATLKGHSGDVNCVAYSHNGRIFASGGCDCQVSLWRLSDIKPVRTMLPNPHSRWVFALAFSPDDKTLASCSSDGTVKLWDVSQRKLRSSHQFPCGLATIAFAPNGKYLAVAGVDAVIRIWGVVEKKVVASWKAHRRLIWSVAFSPDGTLLASASDDKTVKIWQFTEMLEQGKRKSKGKAGGSG